MIGDLVLLPFVAGDGLGLGDVTLEAFTATGTHLTGIGCVGDCTIELRDAAGSLEGPLPLEAYTATATGLCGEIGSAAVTLELLTATSDFGSGAAVSLEAYTVSATGLLGAALTADLTLQHFTLDASGHAQVTATADLALQAFTSTGTLDNAPVGVGDALLAARDCTGTLIPGGISTAQLTVPLYEVDASGHADLIGTASVRLALRTVDGVMTGGTPTVTTAIVLNTRTRAASTYANMPFDSLCSFGGVVLAAGASGIVALTGDNDMGTPIEAYIESGTSALGTDRVKRVVSGYVGYRTSGRLKVTLTTDEDQVHEYDLDPRQYDNLHASRVKFARGVKGVYWGWRLDNVDGADFDLDHLTLNPEATLNRI